ncbi:MAG TPA: DUF4142 domain-containing protein [Terriglobales bacterium]|nr:DUF4142 domain-containing protein [Terriglobales bacterium]
MRAVAAGVVGAMVMLVQATSAQQVVKLTPMDQQVVEKVHQANQMEIQIGKMAEQKGRNPEVKRYGALLARDHQKGDQLVTDVAKEKGLSSIPEPMPQTPADKEEMLKQLMMMQQLQQAQGSEFDTVFAKSMVQAHEKAIAMVSDASKQVQDADLRDTLTKLVPILKQHLDIAQRLSRGPVGTTGRR